MNGVRIGRLSVFLPALVGRDATTLRAALSAARRNAPAWLPPADAPSVPADGRVSPAAYAAAGYVPLGPRVLRAETAERLAQRAFERSQSGRLLADDDIAALAGCTAEQAAEVLRALGYSAVADGRFEWRRRKTA